MSHCDECRYLQYIRQLSGNYYICAVPLPEWVVSHWDAHPNDLDIVIDPDNGENCEAFEPLNWDN